MQELLSADQSPTRQMHATRSRAWLIVAAIVASMALAGIGAAIAHADGCDDSGGGGGGGGSGGGSIAVEFPDYEAKHAQHGAAMGVTLATEYAERAVAIVGGRNPGVEQCEGMDYRTSYWDPVEETVVFKQYGVITNYHKATRAHYEAQCVD